MLKRISRQLKKLIELIRRVKSFLGLGVKFNIEEIEKKDRRTIFIDYKTKIEVSEKYCNCHLDNITE